MSGSYDDIIHLPHHVSATRPHMSPLERAAQFSPFSALSGYGAAVKEAGRLTESRIELSEDEKARLDEKQQIILNAIDSQPEITITYFVPDEKKDGGRYISVTGIIRKIDDYERILVLTDETKIPLDDIIDIDSVLFSELF